MKMHLERMHPDSDEAHFNRGYNDGMAGRPCKVLGLQYINGYQKGKRIRELQTLLTARQR